MSEQRPRRVTGWTYLGVFVVSAALLLPVMAADMIANRGITILSAVALPVIAALGASKVRLNDASAAWWAPPLIWVVGLETVGQIGRDFTIETVRSQVVHLVYGLADQAVSIIGSSLLAALIVLRRRARQL